MSAHVLVIQLARLGDLAQSLPLIFGLKQAGARVDLICGFDPGDWLRERLDSLMVLDTRSLEQGLEDPAVLFTALRTRLGTLLAGSRHGSWDHVICLNDAVPATELAALLPGNSRCGAGVAGDPYAAWLAALGEERGENLVHLSEMMLASVPWVEGQVSAARVRNSRDIVIHSGSGSRWRQLEPLFWRGLLRELVLAMPGHRLLLTGNASERATCEKLALGIPSVINLAGRTSLDELLLTLENAALVIAQDTGVLHLAAATSTPLLGLYHASARVTETGPFQHGAHVLEVSADCHPCHEGAPTCANLDCRHWIEFHGVARIALAILRGETPPHPADPRLALWRCEFEGGGWLLRDLGSGGWYRREEKLAQLAFLRGDGAHEPLMADGKAWRAACANGMDHASWQRRLGVGSPVGLLETASHWKAACLTTKELSR
ncbi:MAG: glycosyltransferase family 9 protein [Calditrichaeota bacterium]|nr:glycosyltransferase family 9 protein [Calditrichota bacterium]